MKHVPVLTKEAIESLQLKPNAKAIDCTLGDGGHSEMILENISPEGKLLGIDADSESLLRAKQNLYRFGDRIVFARDNFVNLKKIVLENHFGEADAILMDLGWSSPQFEERGRGFSFQKDEPLDMRYDPSSGNTTAGWLVNNLSEKELEKIFREYGEEKLSGKIAKMICEKRTPRPFGKLMVVSKAEPQAQGKKIETTKDLVEIAEAAYGGRRGKINPATRIFQALRIAVNDELGVLKKVLPDAVAALKSGGRLSVITFHSLEDRIVKHYFKSQDGKILKIINKKPIVATREECSENPRARSAKLRIIERL